MAGLATPAPCETFPGSESYPPGTCRIDPGAQTRPGLSAGGALGLVLLVALLVVVVRYLNRRQNA